MNKMKNFFILPLLTFSLLNLSFLFAEDKPGHIITNSIGIRLAYIPAGSFLMGSPYDEAGRQEDEFQHKVTISRPFRISVTEITQAQWQIVIGINRSQFKGDSLPVEKMSWKEAVLFCQMLSEKEGRTYRLPTEAEWEYACRAGSMEAFAGSGDIEQVAWYANNSKNKTQPVATKKPNAWKLYDMHGNVSEWCLDYYAPDYPEHEVSDPRGPAEGKYHIIRGGAWDSFPPGCRSAARSSAPVSYQFKQTGFRIVLELK